MKAQHLRWGILSTAHIVRKNWKAIQLSGNGAIVAVASRSLEKSRAFINELQAHTPFDPAPRAMGSYEELLASSDVDAVYIPLPTGIRKEWVIRAAKAGKHVLCEKPCATSFADLAEMVEACRHHGVQFMDGVMFMHSGRLPAVREALNSPGVIGPVKRITSAFSFCAPPEFFAENIRADSRLEPFGCLGDLGWYCIRFSLWTMNWQMPEQVTGRILSEGGAGMAGERVPAEFSGELFFRDGASSSFYCSFITHNEQWAHVTGTQGHLRIPDFVAPFFGAEVEFQVNNTTHVVTGCDFNMEPHWKRYALEEHSNGHPTSQETNMVRTFARQVQSGALSEHWPEIALKTQKVLDQCLAAGRRSLTRSVE